MFASRRSTVVGNYTPEVGSEPVDGIKQVYRGFVISTTSDDEISNLLSLFGTLATISAFIAGIIMTCLVSVNMQEIQSAQAFMAAAGFPNNMNDSYLVSTCAFGAVFSGLAIIGSTMLYISLSSLNIGAKHECSDALLLMWLQKFSFYYMSVQVCAWAAVICMTFALYFVSSIKYPTIADGKYSFGYGAVGVIFIIAMTLGIGLFVRLHWIMIGSMRAEFDKFNASTLGATCDLGQNILSGRERACR